MAAQTKPEADADRTLVLTRLFDAPRERVFEAWLDPKQISEWIGPRTVKAEAKEMSPKPGGRYRIFMRGNDGKGPMVGGVFREIARPERIVMSWAWETAHPMGEAGEDTLITLTFRSVGAKTEMTLRHEFFSTKGSRDSHNEGWGASFDKMAEMLARK